MLNARQTRARDLYQSGVRFLGSGRTAQARESLLACVRADSTAADCHRALGALYLQGKNPAKGRRHLERYLELAPEAPDAATIRATLQRP